MRQQVHAVERAREEQRDQHQAERGAERIGDDAAQAVLEKGGRDRRARFRRRTRWRTRARNSCTAAGCARRQRSRASCARAAPPTGRCRWRRRGTARRTRSAWRRHDNQNQRRGKQRRDRGEQAIAQRILLGDARQRALQRAEPVFGQRRCTRRGSCGSVAAQCGASCCERARRRPRQPICSFIQRSRNGLAVCPQVEVRVELRGPGPRC